MDENRITGALKDVAGKAQEAFGEVTGDRTQQAQGKARQVEGKIEGAYGEAVDTVRQTVEGSPIVALAVTAGVAFLLGALVTGGAKR